ncbi:hypothetical protein JCM8097_000420 [Rhodosporidiobolus ruineniae]
MGWTDNIPGLSSLASSARANLPRSTSSFSAVGIEGKQNGEVLSGANDASLGGGAGGGGGARKVDGRGRWWDDEDGTSPLGIALRILQTFFPFVNLCIYIAMAAFQKKWGVGVSFLVGFSLFVNIEALLHGGIILATFLLADTITFLRGLERAMKQIRVAVIVNTFQSGLMLLLAIVATVSANVGGCKDASKDAHADTEGYTDALPGFCRDKRAGAAFYWLTFFAWAGSLALTLLVFTRIRRHPSSSGFAIPGSSSAAGSQFPADADEEAAFSRASYEVGYAPAGTGEHDADGPFADPHGGVSSSLGGGGYRPSHDYTREPLFDEDGLRGQGYDQPHPGQGARRDPFEDPEEGYGGGGGAGRYGGTDDPYEAIRKSMDVRRAQY